MIGPEPRTTLCASLLSQTACQHFTRATFYGMYRKNAAPQKLGPHFASLRSRNPLQRVTRATLYRNLQEKCCSPKPRSTLCASLRSRNALQRVTRATLYRNLQEKCCSPKPRSTLCSLRSRTHVNVSQEPLLRKCTGKMLQPKTTVHTLCEPAQSKRMSTFHKSHFIRKFTGKMRKTRVSTLIKHRPLHLP